MGKNLKKWLMATNSSFYLLGKSGAWGEDGKKAADEYEAEVGPLLVIVILIVILIGLFLLVVSAIPGT